MPVQDWGETLHRIWSFGSSGNTTAPIQIITEIITSMPEGPWRAILDLDFTSDPKELAELIDDFIIEGCQGAKVGALYAEMEAFHIGNDWDFNLYGYQLYGGLDDHEWLCEWDCDRGGFELSGFEEYSKKIKPPGKKEWYLMSEDEKHTYRSGKDHADLLIVCKFQDLIRRAVEQTKLLNVPMLATVHEYDYIAEIRK